MKTWEKDEEFFFQETKKTLMKRNIKWKLTELQKQEMLLRQMKLIN